MRIFFLNRFFGKYLNVCLHENSSTKILKTNSGEDVKIDRDKINAWNKLEILRVEVFHKQLPATKVTYSFLKVHGGNSRAQLMFRFFSCADLTPIYLLFCSYVCFGLIMTEVSDLFPERPMHWNTIDLSSVLTLVRSKSPEGKMAYWFSAKNNPRK